MFLKGNCSMLFDYDKMIVYGAGAEGTRFLRLLCLRNFDKTKVVVWDKGYKMIGRKYDFIVTKPDFSGLKNGKDVENTLVVIALDIVKNRPIINEIEQGFIASGYQHITVSSYIYADIHKISEFENKAYMDCSYQSEMDFTGLEPLVKPIAFYLPQFHEIPENNEWWGKGFTEWTNSAKAKPRFRGHYQPREPHDDIGHYDLSEVNAIRKQAELAKRHGIYGWCIYYYWFSGKKLLTKPIDLLLANEDIDMNFCLFWCNEPWTKSWVGNPKKELIKNEYGEEEPEKFIDDIRNYMEDDRYIKIDGKPIIIIYNIQEIPDIRELALRWRKHAMTIGIGEIAIFSTVQLDYPDDFYVQGCLDGKIELATVEYAINEIQFEDEQGSIISNQICSYVDCFQSYKLCVEESNHSSYLSCLCGFDNTPRYQRQFSIYDLGFSTKDFYDAVKYVTDEAIKYNKEFIFLFAWNEWAEGAYLEPDKRFGYTMINTLSKAICGLALE